jgi:hypothetical protein
VIRNVKARKKANTDKFKDLNEMKVNKNKQLRQTNDLQMTNLEVKRANELRKLRIPNWE